MFVGRKGEERLAAKLHPGIAQFFDYINNVDLSSLPLGKTEISGSHIFFIHNDIDGVKAENQPLEMHREYIDIHLLLEGEERIGYLPLSKVEHYSQEYKSEGDCALSPDAPDFYVQLYPGDYCIVFPEDPHAPAISSGRINKIIGKVRI